MPEPTQNSSEQEQQQQRAALVAAVVALLAINASAEATAAQVAILMPGIPLPLILAAIVLAQSQPTQPEAPSPDGSAPKPPKPGSAEEQTREEAPYYRAAYVEASTRRTADNVRRGKSVEDSVTAERINFERHLDAQRNRLVAARAVDRAVALYGSELGWYARMDDRTSPECRQAHGKNFSIEDPPLIGYPGAVHLTCRCKAGRAFQTSKHVNDVSQVA